MNDLVTVLLMLACAGVMAATVKFFGDDEIERQRHERGERPWLTKRSSMSWRIGSRN